MGSDKKTLFIGLGALAVAAVAAVIYVRRPVPPPPAPPAPVEAPAPAPPPAPPAEPLPSLADSDGWIRNKLTALITSPYLSDWLKIDNLVRRGVAAVSLIADGNSPRDALSFLGPNGKFKAVKKGGILVPSPEGFKRYDAVADAVATLDAQGAAKLVNAADPLFQQACSELGAMNCSFKDSLLRAIHRLASAPVPVDPALRAKVISYAYVDEKLEKLDKAQKHLLRMGPINEQKVQNKLRELGRDLGATDL